MAGQAIVTIEESGLTNLVIFLRQITEKARRLDDILQAAFNTHGFRDIIDHFANEEGPEGAWPKRSQTTQDMYEAIHQGRRQPPRGIARGAFDPGNKLLQLTGNLRKSLLRRGGNVRKLGGGTIQVFSPVKYSGVHDTGGKHIPKREYMWLSKGAVDKMAVDILDLLVGI